MQLNSYRFNAQDRSLVSPSGVHKLSDITAFGYKSWSFVLEQERISIVAVFCNLGLVSLTGEREFEQRFKSKLSAIAPLYPYEELSTKADLAMLPQWHMQVMGFVESYLGLALEDSGERILELNLPPLVYGILVSDLAFGVLEFLGQRDHRERLSYQDLAYGYFKTCESLSEQELRDKAQRYARVIGQYMHFNPILFAIPCHIVGSPSSYALGDRCKRWLRQRTHIMLD